jgi:putative molybdopterin biosynthesis protein
LADLAQPGVTFVNRQNGSGTRLWLDRALAQAGIEPAVIRGYGLEVTTHRRVAQIVAAGEADAGLGVSAAAREQSLEFIPLYQERFDLVLPEQTLDQPRLRPLLDQLNSRAFRRTVGSLEGYDAAHTGELILVE